MIVFFSCLGMFFLGWFLGSSLRIKRIEEKKQEVQNLITEVRNKNNEMLANFSKVAHTTTNTEGQWTEVDDFLMPMWME